MTAKAKPLDPAFAPVTIGLNAVIAVVDDETPKVLCVRSPDGSLSLPYGPFDPERHRTFEVGLLEWVERQTSVKLGFVEQLYTFGDKGRESPAALIYGADPNKRTVSVGYLALAAAPADVGAAGAGWRSWYEFFPWEDWRKNEPLSISDAVMPGFDAWIARAPDAAIANRRRERINIAFGFTDVGWEEERALDRYELMYEAGLVIEAWRDRAAAGLRAPGGDERATSTTGSGMISDHRRILATAIGRIRGKLKYRPVIFDLLAHEFSLFTLQKTAEALVGFTLHKQNFRRSAESSALVEKTGRTQQQKSGRPAALFTISRTASADRAARGLSIPRLKRSPRIPLKSPAQTDDSVKPA